MELDELKLAWLALDRRVENQQLTALALLRDRKLDKVSKQLRPLQLGQSLQIIAGVLLVAVSASFWITHRDSLHLLISGLLVHVYGLMFVGFAIRHLYLIARIDYAAPVLAIQQRLAELTAWRVRAELGFGVIGCVIWIPLLLMICAGLGADIWLNSTQVASWAAASALVSLAVLFGMLWIVRRPSLAHWRRALENSSAGRGIRQSRAVLDELARFEQA